MAMLIAWQALNKPANTQDARFADTFLIGAPGIIIKDCMRDLVEVHFPQAEKNLVGQAQLNTHSPACLYEVFAPAEAKRILSSSRCSFGAQTWMLA